MVGYLGPKFSFSYFAAATFYVKDELQPFPNIYRLFEALDKGEVIGIVVPIENSIEGTVNQVVDLLSESDYHINREIVLDIQLSLLSKNNDLQKIKYVHSHPHALAQCRNTLQQELEKYKEIPESSTSDALKRLSNLSEEHAAIASKQAPVGNLNVLLHNIRDAKYNATRFIYVTKTLEVRGFHNKTSIMCVPKQNVSGALYDILHEFAIRGIDLTKIESRPKKELLGDYIFFIDIAGNIEEEVIKDALEMIKHKTNKLIILGSYYSK